MEKKQDIKTKRINRIIRVIVIILVFIYWNPYNIFTPPFSRSDKAWLSIYQPGDTLIFRSVNKVDTIVFEPLGDSIGPFGLGSELIDEELGKGKDHIYIYKGHILHAGSQPRDFYMVFEKKKLFVAPTLDITFAGLGDSKLELVSDQSKPATFNGKNVDSWLVCEDHGFHYDDPLGSPEENQMRDVTLCKEYGVIEYSYKSEDIYRLVKHIKQDGEVIEY